MNKRIGLSSKLSICLLLATCALTNAERADAATITFIHDGTMNGGTLANQEFGEGGFTITATADTTTIVSCGVSCLSVDHITASIAFNGGSYDFLTTTRTIYQDNDEVIGFGFAGSAALFLGPDSDELNSYGLNSPIVSIVGFGIISGWKSGDVSTSGGILNLFDYDEDDEENAEFSASISSVPVPAPLALFLTGLAGLGILSRRRKKSAI